jgi:hypothetical protein
MLPILLAMGILGAVVFVGSRIAGSLRAALRLLFLMLGVGVAAMVLMVAVVFLQAWWLDAHAGYAAVVDVLARLGPRIALASAIALGIDLVALVIYVIRSGQDDGQQGQVVTDGPLPMQLGAAFGTSRRKVLVSKDRFVTTESLVDGTATRGERLFALGIVALFLSFFGIFVGMGLTFLKDLSILAAAFIAVPGYFAWRALIRPVWADYRRVKAGQRDDGWTRNK